MKQWIIWIHGRSLRSRLTRIGKLNFKTFNIYDVMCWCQHVPNMQPYSSIEVDLFYICFALFVMHYAVWYCNYKYTNIHQLCSFSLFFLLIQTNQAQWNIAKVFMAAVTWLRLITFQSSLASNCPHSNIKNSFSKSFSKKLYGDSSHKLFLFMLILHFFIFD